MLVCKFVNVNKNILFQIESALKYCLKMLIKVDKLRIESKSIKKAKSFTLINTANNEVLVEEFYNKKIYRGLKMWITFVFFNFTVLNQMNAQESFLENQIKFERVADALNSKTVKLEKEFKEKGLVWPIQGIYLRSFKSEQELEVWVKENNQYQLFKTYDICKSSGQLGPKFEQGDLQVPEGLYYIDKFNPESKFWLSLRINYPNKADLIRTSAIDPGGDIYIHGECVTVGCLPMTNDIMKEIYVLSLLAQNNTNQFIPIHIYPFRFNSLNNVIYHTLYSNKDKLWNNLEEEYNYFNQNYQIRDYIIDDFGNYIFQN